MAPTILTNVSPARDYRFGLQCLSGVQHEGYLCTDPKGSRVGRRPHPVLSFNFR